MGTPDPLLSSIPGTDIGLGDWTEYSNYYFLNATNSTHKWVAGPEDDCFCKAWTFNRGSDEESVAAFAIAWVVFSLSVLQLLYYAYAQWRSTCGWEEVYVGIIELTHICIAIFREFDSPAMLYLSTGNFVVWARYASWLLSCPVILIHLSNLTGMKGNYSKRTMALLVSDIGTIVWGSTSAMSPHNHVKIIFFFLGLVFGLFTFYAAAKVYLEAYHTVPKGKCRNIVRFMAWTYYVTWALFPILFILGPEGFGHITYYGSSIGHYVLEIFSKNLWSGTGHYLRLKIHEHIILHGNLTKKTKINIAGEPLEVEEYVEADDTDEGV
nr:AgChR [synthetic construct]